MKFITNIFKEIWEWIVEAYTWYSDLIHSAFPAELGDLVVAILDLVIIALIIKIVSSYAFRKHH